MCCRLLIKVYSILSYLDYPLIYCFLDKHRANNCMRMAMLSIKKVLNKFFFGGEKANKKF